MPPKIYETGSDAELYDHYRDLKLSPEDAKLHVERRRAARNQPTEVIDSTNPDQGPIDALRIGASEGLSGTAGGLLGGAAVGTLTGGPIGTIIGGLGGAYLGSKVPRAASVLAAGKEGPSVAQQYDATAAGSPRARLTGDILGGLFGAYGAGKVAKYGMGLRTAAAAERGAMLDNELKAARLAEMRRPQVATPRTPTEPPMPRMERPPLQSSYGGTSSSELGQMPGRPSRPVPTEPGPAVETSGPSNRVEMNRPIPKLVQPSRPITQDPIARQMAGGHPPINPRTGQPVRAEEIQAVLDKERRINQTIKDRPQAHRTQAQFDYQRNRMGQSDPLAGKGRGRPESDFGTPAERPVPGFSQEIIRGLSDEELRTSIAEWTRNRSASPQILQEAKAELARRAMQVAP